MRWFAADAIKRMSGDNTPDPEDTEALKQKIAKIRAEESARKAGTPIDDDPLN